eukprot:UN32757
MKQKLNIDGKQTQPIDELNKQSTDAYYWSDTEGVTNGPVKVEEIVEKGVENPNVYVWRKDFKTWLPFNQLENYSKHVQTKKVYWYILFPDGKKEGPLEKWDIINKVLGSGTKQSKRFKFWKDGFGKNWKKL